VRTDVYTTFPVFNGAPRLWIDKALVAWLTTVRATKDDDKVWARMHIKMLALLMDRKRIDAALAVDVALDSLADTDMSCFVCMSVSCCVVAPMFNSDQTIM